MASCELIGNVVSRGSDVMQPLLQIMRSLFFFKRDKSAESDRILCKMRTEFFL